MKFENEPPHDQTMELVKSLEAGFETIEKLSAADLKRLMGGHLSERRLKLHAEGDVDFGAAEKENVHLSLCDSCSDEVLRLERDHVRRLKELAAGTLLSIKLDSANREQRVVLLVCRSFRMDLISSEQHLFLEIEADDPFDIENLGIACPSLGKSVDFTKQAIGSGRLKIGIGPIPIFDGQSLDISFKYREEVWSKNIFIQVI